MRAAYPGSRWRRGVSMRSRTRGCPGTISAPDPVATSTRRRTRSGRLSANCCASPPPQEMPRTSACSWPSWSSRPASSDASVFRWYGSSRGRRAADARHVEPDDFPPRIERVDERLEQLQARADAVAQQQRRPARGPLPHRDPQGTAADPQDPHPLGRPGPAQPASDHPAKASSRAVFPGRPGTGLSMVIDVGPRCVADRHQPAAAELPGAAFSSPQRSASQPA